MLVQSFFILLRINIKNNFHYIKKALRDPQGLKSVMNGANKGELPVHQEIVDRDPELKRVRTLSRKALENAVEEKHREIACVHNNLLRSLVKDQISKSSCVICEYLKS